MKIAPSKQIKRLLSEKIPSDLISKLPDKWEKIGDILIIKLPSELNKYRTEIGEKYAKVLQCKTVLQDISGVSGIYREPNVEIIYGVEDTETVHKENGIIYKLDARKIMFSSGNMDERIRMANVSNKDEVVVDLFAGIGYFTLPIAVYSKPRKIFACEINPVAYDYLCQNIVLNHVASVVEPLLGDNRAIGLKNVADRVVMGYISSTYEFLSIAFDCLKSHTGVIHYHEVFPNELLPDKALENIQEIAGKCDRKTEVLTYKRVKSYAPGVSHVVLDVQVG